MSTKAAKAIQFKLEWRRQDLARGGTPNNIKITCHTHKITQNKDQTDIHCVTEKSYIPFHFFSNKMKSKLTLVTVVCKILKTFDTRDCLHTFIAPKCGRKNKLLGVKEGGPCPNVNVK